MKWKKIGLIIEFQKELDWMRTHAMLPISDPMGGSLFRVYFCGRDDQNRSHIGFAVIDMDREGKVLEYSKKAVLSPGELGCFDDNGVSPSWILNHENKKFLYYIGWKPRSTTRMGLIAGLAVSEDGGLTFNRISRAPILRLTDKEPFMILTAPCVLKEGSLWKMWYVSGFKWEHADLPCYNIKYAESQNGVDWNQPGTVCIESPLGNETSLARPCVFKDEGAYKMFYSYKRDGNPYRIGYAESPDGIKWTRKDEEVEMDVSQSGWDSEMIEYAYIFPYKKRKYMLYNGNGYGLTGAGLAVLEG